MDKIIKNILKRIESEGYEAYLVGGFVRDSLLKKTTYDIDICTNALPMNLKDIFNINNSNSYGGCNISIKKYNIDITTYRKEISYNNRRPDEVEYISNLIEDINRRDFTINAICMDKNEHILDPLEGMEDLKNGIIRAVGDPDKKFKDDPLRILRGIRFASILNFKIEPKTLEFIKKNSELVKTLSPERVKLEISKLLANKNFNYGLELLKECNIDKIIGLKYDNIVYTSDIIGMYSQINIDKIILTKNEKENVSKIRQILNIKKIEYHELFNYGLYLCLVAGEILGISKDKINKLYKQMPIKSMKDINISGKDILTILNIEPGKKISMIMADIRNAILNGKIKNQKNDIKKYLLENYYE